jgi:hypothetical protein
MAKSLTIRESIQRIMDGVRKDSSRTPFRTLLRQLESLGVDLDESVDILNNEEFFENLSIAVDAGQAVGIEGKPATSVHNFRDAVGNVINRGSTSGKNITQSKIIKEMIDDIAGKKRVKGDQVFRADSDYNYVKATRQYAIDTVKRHKDVITSTDTPESVLKKIEDGTIKPYQAKKAIQDLSIKNYFFMHGTTGVRGEENLDISIRKDLTSKEIYDGKRPYNVSDGIIRNINIKGGGQGIAYPLGNFHQGIMADQIRLANINRYLVSNGKIKQSFVRELWPFNRQHMNKTLSKNIRVYFLDKRHPVKWIHDNTGETDSFKVNMLRNQFSRLARTSVDENDDRLLRLMTQEQGNVTTRFYSRSPVDPESLKQFQQNMPESQRKITTSTATDLDELVKFYYADGMGTSPAETSRSFGANTVNTRFDSLPSVPEDQVIERMSRLNNAKVVLEKPDQFKEVFSSSETKDFPQADKDKTIDNIADMQDEYKQTGNIVSKSTKTAEPEYLQSFGNALDEHGSRGVRKRKRLDKALNAAGKIGKKLPFVGTVLGAGYSLQTLSTPSEAFAAPEGGDLASKVFGLETGEERQKARAAYQTLETLPIVPMFIPPAEDIFPTEQEREEEREQTGAQMEALFTGA